LAGTDNNDFLVTSQFDKGIVVLQFQNYSSKLLISL